MAKKKSSNASPKSGKKSETKKETPRFEDALAELEQVVGELESGKLPLSESIQRYEDGVKLLKQCHQSINQVKRKIELLTQVDQQGQATTVPFDADGTAATEPARGNSPVAEDPDQDVDESGRLF